ncbi:MAG: RsbRD N-terminal domain-containing protein, partial [Peptococcales bacterium]
QAVFNLKKFLTENKETLLTRWFHLVLDAYPKETSQNFKNMKSQFANPVGHNIHEGLNLIYDELIYEFNEENLKDALDKVLRIMAVQEILPSQAIGFISKLKRVVREGIGKELKTGNLVEEVLAFEDKVDQAMLLGFNIYLECRETIYKMRLHEVKTRCDILERVNLYNNN